MTFTATMHGRNGGRSLILSRHGMTGGAAPIVMTAAWMAAWAAAACMAAAMAAPTPALAQQVVLIVNGDVITDYDIDQRMKFITVSTHKTPTRAEVIEDLIDEKLKIQVGRRYKLDLGDKEIDQSYADMGKRMHITAEQLTQSLNQAGINPVTLKARIRADITWSAIVRGKFQSSLQVSEKSVLAEIETRKKDDATEVVGYDYTLRPILFVVPRGNTEALELRRKDAEALRLRFTDCNTGLPFARSLRDVAIREPITKNSSDLALALREILDKTELGHLTPPETTAQGVEFFALCEKKETKAETPEKREAREKIFGEQFQSKSKRYLQELRRQAMIERK
jgi:peptidyl-prolyl cis-trans isomerase SurA